MALRLYLATAAALRVKGCKLEYLELSDFMLLLSIGLLEVVGKGKCFLVMDYVRDGEIQGRSFVFL